MKKIITTLLAASALCLTSCGNPKEYNTAISHLKAHLKDPGSLIVEGATGFKGEYAAFKIYYNAKNSFGGYVGTDIIYIVVDSSTYCSECEEFGDLAISGYSILSKSGAEQLNIDVSK